jgi:hypothetical protein
MLTECQDNEEYTAKQLRLEMSESYSADSLFMVLIFEQQEYSLICIDSRIFDQ